MVRKSRVCIPGRDLSWSLRDLLAGIGSTEELQLGPEVVQVRDMPQENNLLATLIDRRSVRDGRKMEQAIVIGFIGNLNEVEMEKFLRQKLKLEF
ncbi:uncharacterized protein A4U43_C01F31040 [Asparagus officinalis]|uniref:Uncharacterized protein n=1 Tax=Asparagus officinalis TaxID=4686 RepID=A0A5P1FTH3_ASPOF|nr:uncharacterized protein A4U43_C01F31040 [Asparagus officinalis]